MNDLKPDNPPAFPSFESPAGGLPGMTLRDYFAARVLGQCQITVDAGKDAPDDADVQATAARFARAAYVIADAMLKARLV